jgi:cytochrome c556
MKNFKLRARGRAIAAATLVALPVLAATGYVEAQKAGDFLPNVTVIELMEATVMPAAQTIWDAVAYDVTVNGETVTGPETDEDWQKLRRTAVTLAESANTLVVPGRHANKPGAKAGDGELAPETIDALMASQREAWVGHAHALYEAAMQVVKAVDAKSAAQVSDAGGVLDSVCEGCHLQFWYPAQTR